MQHTLGRNRLKSVVRPRFHLYSLVALVATLLAPAAWMVSTPVRAAAPKPINAPALLIASLNIAMEGNADAIAAEIRAHDAVDRADAIFLQEVVRQKGVDMAVELGKRLGREVVFASPDGEATRSGLAILTRIPARDVRTHALKPQNLIFRSRKRVALAATMDTILGPVRLVNTHLDTRINPAERLDQLAPALTDALSFSGPAVIGGDFNTNDMQWVSNVVPVPFPGWQASRVRILMSSRGFETPFVTRRATFDHLGMQLDWIFTNKLRATDSGIQPLNVSDHHAVWAKLALEQ